MKEENEIQFTHLEHNLESAIYEGILKIGFQRGEAVSIYYTTGLICHLLGLQSDELLPEMLNNFLIYMRKKWGQFAIARETDRVKLTMPSDGVEAIHKKNGEDTFLKDLIQEMNLGSVTLSDVLRIFHKYSDDVICESAENDEFDYVIYFADPTIDEYKYCFTFGEMGQYYHRLLPYDFAQLDE